MSDMSETYLDQLLAQELLKNEKSREINLNSKMSSDWSREVDSFPSNKLPYENSPLRGGRRLPGIDEEEFSVNTQLLSHIWTRNGTVFGTNKTRCESGFETNTRSVTEFGNRLTTSTATEPPGDGLLSQSISLDKKELLEPIMEVEKTGINSMAK